jgi:hypothetical protein
LLLRNDIIFRTLYKTLLSADKAAKVVKIYELRNKNLLLSSKKTIKLIPHSIVLK